MAQLSFVLCSRVEKAVRLSQVDTTILLQGEAGVGKGYFANLIHNASPRKDKPFIRVVDHLPATKDVRDTNFCDITARVVRGRVITISCIDNLVKGASGAAVQNMNLMFGFPETTAL